MFFMKKEKKRCHPCVKLALIGLAVVGAVAVVDKSKCFIADKICFITRVFKRKAKDMTQCNNGQ